MKAQIVYWLLGATDGHAKNFSLSLMPGGRFRLAPLYDVMSSQPIVDARQLRRNKMKFAMAVGDNRHYIVGEILPRHFRQTATGNGVSDETVDEIFSSLIRQVPDALEATTERMPENFPKRLVDSISGGVMSRLRLFELRNLTK